MVWRTKSSIIRLKNFYKMSRKSNEKKKRATKQVEFAKLDHKVAALWTRVSSEKQ